MAKATIKARTENSASEVLQRVSAVAEDMVEEKREVETRKEPSKEEQLVNFKLPKSKYEEYKKMFGAAGYSFSKGTRMILDYIYSEVQSGNIEIRESGIKQTLSARVGR
jgi:predicted porin